MQFNNLSECTQGCCDAARKKRGRKRKERLSARAGNTASCIDKTSEAARGAASLYIYKETAIRTRPPLRHQASAFKTASPMPAVVTFVVPGSKMSAVRRPLASTLRTAASMRSACGARFSE